MDGLKEGSSEPIVRCGNQAADLEMADNASDSVALVISAFVLADGGLSDGLRQKGVADAFGFEFRANGVGIVAIVCQNIAGLHFIERIEFLERGAICGLAGRPPCLERRKQAWCALHGAGSNSPPSARTRPAWPIGFHRPGSVRCHHRGPTARSQGPSPLAGLFGLRARSCGVGQYAPNHESASKFAKVLPLAAMLWKARAPFARRLNPVPRPIHLHSR